MVALGYWHGAMTGVEHTTSAGRCLNLERAQPRNQTTLFEATMTDEQIKANGDGNEVSPARCVACRRVA